MGRFDEIAGLTEAKPAFPRDRAKYRASIKEGVDNGVRLNIVDRVRENVEQEVGDPRFKGKPGWRLCRKAMEPHTTKLSGYVDAVANSLAGLVGEDTDPSPSGDEGALDEAADPMRTINQHATAAHAAVRDLDDEAKGFLRGAGIGKGSTEYSRIDRQVTKAKNALKQIDKLSSGGAPHSKIRGKRGPGGGWRPEDEEHDGNKLDEADDETGEAALTEDAHGRFDALLAEGCATPGMKKRSEGKGKGLAKGDGEGPIGEPDGVDEEDSEAEGAAEAEQDAAADSADPMDEWERAVTPELTEDKDVAKAQKELNHLIQMLRTLALKHTKTLPWASTHGEDYQNAARDAKRGLQQMVMQLANLH